MIMYGVLYYFRLSNKIVFKMFCWFMEFNKVFCYFIFVCWFVEGVVVVVFFFGGGVGGGGGVWGVFFVCGIICFVSWYVGGGCFCFWFKDLKKIVIC